MFFLLEDGCHYYVLLEVVDPSQCGCSTGVTSFPGLSALSVNPPLDLVTTNRKIRGQKKERRQKHRTRSRRGRKAGGRDEEEYAKDKVWLAVGGISNSGGDVCGNKLSAGIH